jgi:AcrR family transcriptional regulator
MTAPQPSPSLSPSARRLVETAERLFALHGIDGVSLRQIATEAGSSNHSAVHYHFGTKEGLITAIFGYRLPQIAHERRLLSARVDPDDLRSRLKAHHLPVLALAEAPDNRYVTFVEQLQRLQPRGEYFERLPQEWRQSNAQFRTELERFLADLDEPLRTMRITESQALCLHAAVDRERSVASGDAVVPFELFVSVLFDGITGYLTTDPSPATMRHLHSVGAVVTPTLRAL